jgi:hypothetical protein
MDAGPTPQNPTMRRLQFAGRLHNIPTHTLCEWANGSYQRLRRSEPDVSPRGGDGQPSTSDLDGTSWEQLPQSNSHPQEPAQLETDAPKELRGRTAGDQA